MDRPPPRGLPPFTRRTQLAAQRGTQRANDRPSVPIVRSSDRCDSPAAIRWSCAYARIVRPASTAKRLCGATSQESAAVQLGRRATTTTWAWRTAIIQRATLLPLPLPPGTRSRPLPAGRQWRQTARAPACTVARGRAGRTTSSSLHRWRRSGVHWMVQQDRRMRRMERTLEKRHWRQYPAASQRRSRLVQQRDCSPARRQGS